MLSSFIKKINILVLLVFSTGKAYSQDKVEGQLSINFNEGGFNLLEEKAEFKWEFILKGEKPDQKKKSHIVITDAKQIGTIAFSAFSSGGDLPVTAHATIVYFYFDSKSINICPGQNHITLKCARAEKLEKLYFFGKKKDFTRKVFNEVQIPLGLSKQLSDIAERFAEQLKTVLEKQNFTVTSFSLKECQRKGFDLYRK